MSKKSKTPKMRKGSFYYDDEYEYEYKSINSKRRDRDNKKYKNRIYEENY